MSDFDFPLTPNGTLDFEKADYKKEKDMFAVMTNEYVNQFGTEFEYYVVTYDKKYDRVWGEDNDRRYIDMYPFTGLLDLPREDHMWNSFAKEGLDTIKVHTSKRHFDAATKPKGSRSYDFPKIGDVIRMIYNNYFYEITDIVDTNVSLLGSYQYSWEFTVKELKLDDVTVDESLEDTEIANITDIDDIFDIANDVEEEIEDIEYTPTHTEKSSDDPFGVW